MAEQNAALDTLRRQHKAVLEYEQNRESRRGPRDSREVRPHLETLNRHLAQWDMVSQAAGGREESPLLTLRKQWRAILGIQEGEPRETPDQSKKAPGKPKPNSKPTPERRRAASLKGAETRKRNAEAKAQQDTPRKGAAAQAGGAAPTDPPVGDLPAGVAGDGIAGGDDPTYKILGKGYWLESHARIVREQIPQVKTAAADPAKYDKAKRDFLKRNRIVLQAYIKAPKKAHSPLFAYCVLYLSDTGKTEQALALAEKAVELRQTSAIKRNFHELLFDVRLAHLESEGPEVVKAGKGPRFDAFTALRDQLMADPFRGNHAKAKVAKIYAQACMALDDYHTAQVNLQQVRFLDPNMGVETLLARCSEKTGSEKTGAERLSQ